MDERIAKSIRIFGSTARGESDALSDLDILVIHDTSNPISKTDLDKFLEQKFGINSSVSSYSIARLQEMSASGHLFSWHLYLESRGFAQNDIFNKIAMPSQYCSFPSDVAPLMQELLLIQEQIVSRSKSLVYEAGLLYLCLRNIAISASWYSKAGLSFSRWAPYAVELERIGKFPLNKDLYNSLIQARLTSMRGAESPELSSLELVSAVELSITWATGVWNQIMERLP